METQALSAAASAVSGVNNHWQVLYAIVICVFGLLGIWLYRRTGESKKLAAKNAEVIAKNEELERERTNTRKVERDKQYDEMKKTITGIGKSLDRHIDEHREKDGKVWGHIENIDNRLQTIEKNLILKTEFDELKNNVHRIDKTVDILQNNVTHIDKAVTETQSDVRSMDKMVTEIHATLRGGAKYGKE
jgi:predicted  nucleic acid-binding Zn-ribbon protein